VRIIEETVYPFEETVRFRLHPQEPVSFPFRLRVPAWARKAQVRLNREAWDVAPSGRMITLERVWREGDLLEVSFDAEVRLSRWVENSVAVERGPLVYALRIEEEWRHVKNPDQWGDYLEVHPKSPWNYGLLESAVNDPSSGFKLARRETFPEYPWTIRAAPLELRAQGKLIPEWQLYNHQAGPLPHSRPLLHLQEKASEPIVLAPYGCTRLRITEFPVVR
jgi:uncharacterized protein